MQNQNWRFLNRAAVVVTVTLLVVSFSSFAAAQDNMTPEQPAAVSAPYQAPPAAAFRPQGTVITPPGSVSSPGKGVHTNYKIFVPAGQTQIWSAVPQYTYAEYPASMACVYKVGPIYAGCVPANNGDHAGGGWGAIALVDAYDDPKAASDLAYFDTYFKLPKANFTKVYANSSFGTLGGLTASCSGTPPPANTNYGWDVEESLDIEWSHVMAPPRRSFW